MLSSKKLNLLDVAGNFLWTRDLNEADFPREFTAVVGNDDTIILYNSAEVVSFNSADGSLRWRYSPEEPVSFVRAAEHGKLLVRVNGWPLSGFHYLDK